MNETNLAALRVLAVDDEPFVLELTKKILIKLGVGEVETLTAAAEALERVRAGGKRIDVILLDMFMPEVDGAEFILKLGALGYDGNIIVVSGADEMVLATAEGLAKMRGPRILGTLQKPVDAAALRELLHQA